MSQKSYFQGASAGTADVWGASAAASGAYGAAGAYSSYPTDYTGTAFGAAQYP